MRSQPPPRDGAPDAPSEVHGERDEIVPSSHGRSSSRRRLPKVLRLLPDAGHNDLIDRAGDEYAEAIASRCDGIGREAGSPASEAVREKSASAAAVRGPALPLG